MTSMTKSPPSTIGRGRKLTTARLTLIRPANQKR